MASICTPSDPVCRVEISCVRTVNFDASLRRSSARHLSLRAIEKSGFRFGAFSRELEASFVQMPTRVEEDCKLYSETENSLLSKLHEGAECLSCLCRPRSKQTEWREIRPRGMYATESGQWRLSFWISIEQFKSTKPAGCVEWIESSARTQNAAARL